MKFITRELYQAMQYKPGAPEEDLAEARWKSNCDAYQRHLETIRDDLPENMRTFSQTSLHDGIIKNVIFPTTDSLTLELDGSHCCWGPIGQFELRFDGVKVFEGLQECIDDWWLYEEVHLHPDAGFDYRVLLEKSQIRIVADQVIFTVVSEGKRRSVAP